MGRLAYLTYFNSLEIALGDTSVTKVMGLVPAAVWSSIVDPGFEGVADSLEIFASFGVAPAVAGVTVNWQLQYRSLPLGGPTTTLFSGATPFIGGAMKQVKISGIGIPIGGNNQFPFEIILRSVSTQATYTIDTGAVYDRPIVKIIS